MQECYILLSTDGKRRASAQNEVNDKCSIKAQDIVQLEVFQLLML